MIKRQDLTIREGETFSWVYTYLDSAGDPVDLTGYTATFKVAGWGSGTVTLGDDAGTVTLSLSALQTIDLAEGGFTGFGAYADAVWGKKAGLVDVRKDLYLEPIQRAYTVYVTSGAGVTTQILEGVATIHRDVDI